MANINLSSFSQEEKKHGRFTEGALVGVCVVLFLVLLVWAGLFFYKKYYLEKNITETQNSYNSYLDQLSKNNSPKVIDFQRRLDVAKKLAIQGRNMQNDLTQVESLVVPNAFLTAYAYDDINKKITLTFVGDNFNTVAKQILSFKNSTYFSSVTAGSSAVDPTTNKITFPIELKIN